MSFTCLLTQRPDLCWFCGEWLHVVRQGGFEGPHGNRYCSQDCIEDLMGIEAEQRRRKQEWCPACGYDRFEHDPLCQQG